MTTLDALAADPSRAEGMARAELRALGLRALMVANVCAVALVGEPDEGASRPPVNTREAAKLLGLTKSQLEHRATKFPYSTFRLPLEGKALYDPDRIAAWRRDPDAYARRLEARLHAVDPRGKRRPAQRLSREALGMGKGSES